MHPNDFLLSTWEEQGQGEGATSSSSLARDPLVVRCQGRESKCYEGRSDNDLDLTWARQEPF